MRFMIIVKATPYTEKGNPIAETLKKHPAVFAAMTAYHEDLAKAGALLDCSGLHPTSKGWRVKYSGNTRTVVDGPFTEAKELIAGYTLFQAKSKEEAMEWVRRFPNPSVDGSEGEIEVRQLFELDEFGESAEIDRFRRIQDESRK
ncbi:MAG TPA: YciI family protein [Candidatus Krumholzibacteria bacterium]|nr:YciI family protein [Candidatus Krumholzibacteria bacterium]